MYNLKNNYIKLKVIIFYKDNIMKLLINSQDLGVIFYLHFIILFPMRFMF